MRRTIGAAARPDAASPTDDPAGGAVPAVPGPGGPPRALRTAFDFELPRGYVDDQ
ncbi:MAG: hypothetical protein HOV68_23800, partial [Streptomycetaceae bacterium]|nr:hypothetical protein [Streptomycetaceae bacterium]